MSHQLGWRRLTTIARQSAVHTKNKPSIRAVLIACAGCVKKLAQGLGIMPTKSQQVMPETAGSPQEQDSFKIPQAASNSNQPTAYKPYTL